RLELGVGHGVDARGSVAALGDRLGSGVGRGTEHQEVQLSAALRRELLAGGDARERRGLGTGRVGFDDDEYLAHRTLASVTSFWTSASGLSTICPAARLGGAVTPAWVTWAVGVTPSASGVCTSTFLRLAMVMPRSDASRAPSEYLWLSGVAPFFTLVGS